MEKEVYEQRLGVRKGGEGAVGRIGNSGDDVCEECQMRRMNEF